ncbi:YsnF/AvaK domain-containing protein [Coleofasciculus sp. FACHB-1120]|nr:YsnF/AvaK domain-containing protein [Coleofasciculus sp. FACHB-1120]
MKPAVKDAANSVKDATHNVADSVKGASEDVKPAVKDAANSVKGATQDVKSSVQSSAKDAANSVKGATQDAKSSVKGAANNVKTAAEDAKSTNHQNITPSDNQNVKLYEEQLIAGKAQVKTGEIGIGKRVETKTANVSIPVEKERVVIERTNPVDAGTPVSPSQVDFQNQEVARMEVHEERAYLDKQAFVHEEVNIHKEVDRDTVELQDKVRREKLDVDAQGRTIVDKTNKV